MMELYRKNKGEELLWEKFLYFWQMDLKKSKV